MQNGLDRLDQRKFALTAELTTKVIHVQCPDHRTAQIILLDIVRLEAEQWTQLQDSHARCSSYLVLHASNILYTRLRLIVRTGDVRDELFRVPRFLHFLTHNLNAALQRGARHVGIDFQVATYLVVRNETIFALESCVGHGGRVSSSVRS